MTPRTSLRLACWSLVAVLASAPARGQAPPPAAVPEALLTSAEKSDFQATATSDEVLALCRALDERSESITLAELGKSHEGRSIPLLIVADPPVTTAEEAAQSGKLVVLMIGNIHAGEVDGKEGLPMLVRELTDAPGQPLLKDVILAIAPNYNPDGNDRMAPDNRPGQVGPAQGMGTRQNAQGFDLNRDFVKLEAPETRALVRWMDQWQPHLFVDAHTTNGSLHRYTITYAGPRHPAGDAKLIAYGRDTFFPAVGAAMEKANGWKSFVYGDFAPDHARWETYGGGPRFGTTYAGLRGVLSVLSEAYSYAPYKDRVLATRDFAREILAYAAAHKDEIKALTEVARKGGEVGEPVTIRAAMRPRAEKATILGFVEESKEGHLVAGAPKEYPGVEVWDDFVTTETVARPAAYVVPAASRAAIETLMRHGIEVRELREDVVLPVEVYGVTSVKRAERPFQGHALVVDVTVEPRTEARKVEAGSFLVPATGPLGSLAVLLLEPRSEDGLTTWNAFDEGLAAGSEFSVVRLAKLPDVALLTAAPAPLPGSGEAGPTPAGNAGTPQRVGSGLQVRFVPGAAGFVRWLDATHFLQQREGKTYQVEADTGHAEPFDAPAVVDRAKLAEALAKLPEVGAAARGLAGRATLDDAGKGSFVEHGGDLYYATLDGSQTRRLTNTDGEEELAKFSPDGSKVAFVRANDLHVVDVATGEETALTTGGSDRVRRGKCDWVYYEEIFNRDWNAFWWSPDSKHIAFFDIDDQHIPEHTVLVEVDPEKRVVEETAYPRSGEPNPHIKFGVVGADGGEVRYADLSGYDIEDFLISDAGWWPDGSAAYCYGQDRAQTWLDVLKVAPDGATTKLFRESSGAWVESLGALRWLGDGSILVASERDGYKHLYVYNPDGTLKNRVTSGEWEVQQVHRVDEASGWVYVSGNRDNPLGSDVYRAKLDGSALERLTQGPGTHAPVFSPDGERFVDLFSSRATPPRGVLRKADGAEVRDLDTNPDGSTSSADAPRVEVVQIPARDGWPIEAEVILPAGLDESGKTLYPVWVQTYGGPDFPTLHDTWRGPNLGASALARSAPAGMVVLRVDPRSASGKSAKAAWAAYRHLGVQELKDIEDAIDWLAQRPYVDASRVGMSGHSYGGYLTAFCLTHSKKFAAGIAGAPVTDWRDYDSIYTERYMNTPQNNPEGYDASSVVKAAKDLHGRLLILHGNMDDNVSVRNTMRLVLALQQADKDFELMIYPDSRHGIFNRHYARLQREFIARTLGGPRPRDAETK